MKLFNRNKTDTDAIPEDLQQYYTSEKTNPLRLLLGGLAALIVLVLLVWLGIWLVNKFTDNGGSEAKTSQSTAQKSQAEEKENNAKTAESKAAADQKKKDEAAKKAAEETKKAEAARQKAEEAAKARAAEQQAEPTSPDTLPNTGG